MDTVKIGKYMMELRRENNLTQEQLAERLGVSNRSVSRWENGNTMPDLPMMIRICRELNTGIAELINGERKTADAESEENIRMILELADRDKERKTKKLNGLFALGGIFLSSIILHELFQIFGIMDAPLLDAGRICLLFALGLIFEAAGFYQNTKGSREKIFTEKEIEALTKDEQDLRMRSAEEMLQVARKHQKAELKQYRKAFQEIAEQLGTDEYAVFSMVGDSYTYDDSPGPWHVALALTNQRLMICGETVRGRMLTRYAMDEFRRDEIRSVELAGRRIVMKTSKGVVKMEGEGFASVINRLKSML